MDDSFARRGRIALAEAARRMTIGDPPIGHAITLGDALLSAHGLPCHFAMQPPHDLDHPCRHTSTSTVSPGADPVQSHTELMRMAGLQALVNALQPWLTEPADG